MAQTFEELFYDILRDYIDTFSIDNFVVPDYRIVEDIASEYLTLRPDVIENSSVSVSSLNQYNGFAIPPRTLDGVFTVLINKTVLMENVNNRRMDWVGTIVHETTHVQDFANYVSLIGAEDYSEIIKIDKHGMFNLWSEIHARANGYYFVRKYTLGLEHMNNPLLLDDIIGRELPAQWSLLSEKYHATKDGYEQAYLVAHYIGRLYTLQQLYPEQFNDRWVKTHFGENTWMTEWFRFYKQHPTLKSAYKQFHEMQRILKQ